MLLRGVLFHGDANSKLSANESPSTLTLANHDSQLLGNGFLLTLTFANLDSELCVFFIRNSGFFLF